MKNITLSLDNIGVNFGNKKLFSGISAQAAGGELLAVTGSNGAGKSTLLKIIISLISPSIGTVQITVDRQNIPKAERMAFIGMVSPELILYNNLSGFENIIFLNKLRQVNLTAGELAKIWETTGLSGREHEQVRFYSTGMRQRLKLAVMLSLNPPIWLLDEPSSNLDESGVSLVNKIIKNALENSAIVVLATNNLEETKYAKSIIRLG